MSESKQKLYCYVDENGQDTQGKIFIVSVIVTGTERDELLELCERIEKESSKGKFKWGKAEHKRRMEYLRRIFENKNFREKLRYSIFKDINDYDTATIKGISQAVHYREPEEYTTLIYIDGLARTKRHIYGARLRRLGVSTRKVQGVTKDENNPLTRLADALAGFIRDVTDSKDKDLVELFEQGENTKSLVKV